MFVERLSSLELRVTVKLKWCLNLIKLQRPFVVFIHNHSSLFSVLFGLVWFGLVVVFNGDQLSSTASLHTHLLPSRSGHITPH